MALRELIIDRDEDARRAAAQAANRSQLARLIVESLAITSASTYAELAEATVRAIDSIFLADGRVVLALSGHEVGACPLAPLSPPGERLESLPASAHGLDATLEIRRASHALDDSERLVAAHLARVTLSSAERLFLLAEAHERARERQEIVAIVSHDLRSPLQTFALGLDAIELAVGEPARQKIQPTAARMKRSIATMTRLLEDLLDVSRIHDGVLSVRLAPQSARQLADELRDQHREIAEKNGLVLTCDVDPGLTLECDAVRLHQALGNVVQNAIRHSQRGTVTLRALPIGADRARFEVVDTGPGIAPEIRAHLFDRLYQGAGGGRAGGLGLGLYIAKGIVDAHGGVIGLESELGRGTTFWIELPRVARTAKERRGTLPPASPEA